MILYIHGFGSSGKGNKANILHGEFEQYNFVTPSLSHIPQLAIDTLEQIIEYALQYEEVYLIGSSLGGYYAIYLANKYNLKAVLINPAVKPYIRLHEALGKALNYHDLSKFEWNESHLHQLRNYDIQKINPEKFMLLSQRGDEVLDYKEGVEKLKGAKQIVSDGGNHAFENIENYFETIKKFFKLL